VMMSIRRSDRVRVSASTRLCGATSSMTKDYPVGTIATRLA
jgi:hypothetical protein